MVVPKEFSRKISVLSFVSSILVVLIHANTEFEYKMSDSWGGGIADFLSCNLALFAVPFFFLVSGFFFGNAGNYAEALKKRFWSVLIPYLLWNTIYALFIFFIGTFVIRLNTRVDVSFGSFVGCIFLGNHNLVSWFLRSLIAYSILTPVLLVLLKNKFVGAVCVAAVFAVSVSPWGGILELKIANMYFSFFYMLGFYMGLHYGEFFMNLKCSRVKFVVCALLFALSQFVYFSGICKEEPWSFIHRCLLVFSLFFLIDYVKVCVRPFMGYTFFIFMAHVLLLESLQKVFFILLPKTEVFGLLNYIGCSSITVCLLIFIADFADRKGIKLYYLLNGSRANRAR